MELDSQLSSQSIAAQKTNFWSIGELPHRKPDVGNQVVITNVLLLKMFFHIGVE
jgi:hypothetical protein